MSVWPSASATPSTLIGAEGELVSVNIPVEPKLLEGLLEALARVAFPINPQIYHRAAVRYTHPDGHEELQPVALVEFPSYEGRLDEVRTVLESYGFARDNVFVKSMLEEIHSNPDVYPPPAGSRCQSVVLCRNLAPA